MALRLFTQAVRGGSWTEQDIEDVGLHSFTLQNSTSHPRILKFNAAAGEHEMPIDLNMAVIFFDDTSTQTFESPAFEGFVEECAPSPDGPVYTCYDPTKKVANEVTVMSAPWDDFETEGTGALPRLVLNATIDGGGDDDYAYCRDWDVNVGSVIAGLLEDQVEPLRYFNAAPTSGDAYDPDDLSTLTFQPQEKLTFESETIRSAIDRMMVMYPNVRMQFHPGSDNRLWRFYNITESPTFDLKLNKIEDGQPPVLNLQMTRSLEGRFTAYKFYGPEATALTTVTTEDGSLLPVEDFAHTFEEYPATIFHIGYRQYVIADADKWRSANILPSAYIAGMGGYNYSQTRSLCLEASFDSGATWVSVTGFYYDHRYGTITLPNYIYFYKDSAATPDAAEQNYFVPDEMRFTYAPYVDPLSLRIPDDGSFAGTAYSIAGRTTTRRIYDEMLAVGWEWGTAVTTLTRVNQFKILAQALLDQTKDIVYSGVAVLDGIWWEFLNLDKRVNFIAYDNDGNELTTGWEDIGAVLTDVEYDFEQMLTSLTFSADLQELLGWDIGSLRMRLKIRAVQQLNIVRFAAFPTRFTQNKFGNGTWIPTDYKMMVTNETLYYDANLGTTEKRL